jgi:hypothetical protein
MEKFPEHPFKTGGMPWWNACGSKPQSIVRLDDRRLGLRVRLASGDRVTMPLGQATFDMRDPKTGRSIFR